MKTNVVSLTKRLVEIRGCLAGKRTATALRRYPPELDEDLLVAGVDPFLIDAECKIAQSQAVRRMCNKTQVLTNPHNFHVRNRITHVGEVCAHASFIASVLGLNVELAKAIALCHDIGHPPFGHDGEAFLRKVASPEHPFNHEVMGVVIAQHVERRGKGLNLTHEVLSGLIRDGEDAREMGIVSCPMSEEAKTVMWGDRFGYVTGDYNDILRIGYPLPSELRRLMECLGENQRARVNRLVTALCVESAGASAVSFSETEDARTFFRIKDLMYELYPRLNASNAFSILERIHGFIQKVLPNINPVPVIALMTDHDAVFLASQPVLDYSHFRQVTVAEYLPLLAEKPIKWWDPDLSW